MWDVCPNIVIGLSILDMLSVLCVLYVPVGGWILYSDRTVCSGHVVSVVCYLCGWDVQI